MSFVLVLFLVTLFVFERQLLGDEVLHAHQPPRVQRARDDRRLHSTTRFVFVLAVAESALVGEVEDVGEGAFDTPELIPDEDTLIGPFSLGSVETFSETFTEIEGAVWNAFGLQVRSPLAIDISDWLRSLGRLPPLR